MPALARGVPLGYPHAVILVSHDRLSRRGVTRISASRSDREDSSATHAILADGRTLDPRKAKQEQDDEIARMRASSPFRYQATKAAQVQSSIKMLDKVVPSRCHPKQERHSISTCPRAADSAGTQDARKPMRLAGSTASTCTSGGGWIAIIAPNGAGRAPSCAAAGMKLLPGTLARGPGRVSTSQRRGQPPHPRRRSRAMELTPRGNGPAIRNILAASCSRATTYTKVRRTSGGDGTPGRRA